MTAAFDLPSGAGVRAILLDNGFDEQDLSEGDLILRRIQTADGRTRGFINDRPASVSLMRSVGQALVEIHGQHDDRALIDPQAHRTLLDQYGGLQQEAAFVARAHADWRATEHELRTHRARVEAAAREADYLRSSVDELSDLAPIAGEEEELVCAFWDNEVTYGQH